MIERLIENWLTKASEKSFQLPFCYILASEGYTILHLTRHCGMEHGKDIIAIDPEGIPCAFQLKGAPEGRIKLRQWQNELIGQTTQLLITPVTHPSIPIGSPHHKSFFVTNGGMEEEVFNAIDAQNKDYYLKGRREFNLNVVVGGDLVERAKRIGVGFIPPDIRDFRSLLDFYMETGEEVLNKEKFAKLIEAFFDQNPKPTEYGKLIRGSALLTALATSSYTNKQNHVAVAEAWMIYISYLLHFSEIHNVPEREWKNELNIANQILLSSIETLWEEVKERDNFLVENVMTDVFISDVKTTWIIGLLSSLGLSYKIRQVNEETMYDILKFCNKHIKGARLWGESAVPYALNYYWFFTSNDATQQPTMALLSIIRTLINRLSNYSVKFLEVYHGIEECCLAELDFDNVDDNTFDRNQKFASNYLEGLTHIFVRDNYLQAMKFLWPELSKISFKSFLFSNTTDFYRWNNKEGKELIKLNKPEQSWQELKQISSESAGEVVPRLLKENAFLVPFFLTVYPHRGDSSIIRWFDSYLSAQIRVG